MLKWPCSVVGSKIRKTQAKSRRRLHLAVDAVQRAHDTIPLLFAYDFRRFTWASGKTTAQYAWEFVNSCRKEVMGTAYIDTICIIRDDYDGLSYIICI